MHPTAIETTLIFSGLFMDHAPTRGWGQEALEKLTGLDRVGSGCIRSVMGQVESSRVGSG